jgi:hypothetical protein
VSTRAHAVRGDAPVPTLSAEYRTVECGIHANVTLRKGGLDRPWVLPPIYDVHLARHCTRWEGILTGVSLALTALIGHYVLVGQVL